MAHIPTGTFLPLLGSALAAPASPGPANAMAAIAVGVAYALGAAAGLPLAGTGLFNKPMALPMAVSIVYLAVEFGIRS